MNKDNLINVLCLILDDSSDSSSSDNENELYSLLFERRPVRRRQVSSRIFGFLERTIPSCSENEFQQHFRVTRTAYEWLLEHLNLFLSNEENVCGRNCIPHERMLLATLWLLATPDSYRSVGNRFNMGKSSLFTSFRRVVLALNSLAPTVIKWPTQAERANIKEVFRNMAGIAGVVGAIDGTYIPIKAPKDNPHVYINRKCFHGITLQAICLPDLKYCDAFTGYPSSVSDIRIFRNSVIYESIDDNVRAYFEIDEHILGDKAYPPTNWCIPPYIDRGRLNRRQINFNVAHAKTRQVIERSFALLFGRFRRLRYLDMNRVDLIPNAIIACCVLHNICLRGRDNLLNEYMNEGAQYVFQDDEDNVEQKLNNDVNGFQKRDNLALNF